MANPLRLPMAGQSLRNLVARPATRRYPVEVRPPFAGARGKIEFDVATCNYCMLCARRCPTLAIRVDRDARVWSIDHLNCIACNACVEVCNKKSLTMSSTPRKAVAASEAVGGHRPLHEEWRPQPETPPCPDDEAAARAGAATGTAAGVPAA